MRAQLAIWIAMNCLTFGAVAESVRAGQFMDNLLNRKAQQTGALPQATNASANYANVVANYGTYAAVPPPLTSTTIPFGVPQTVAGYLPTASYDTQWNPAQVTYYRPVTTFDPRTGTTVTSMQPCTSLQYQAQRVPLAAPVAVLGNNGLQANSWPSITGPGYYPAGLSNAAYYPGFQQVPPSGAPISNAPIGSTPMNHAPMGNSGVSMGMPASSLPVRTFSPNTALPPAMLPATQFPTATLLPATTVSPMTAAPTSPLPVVTVPSSVAPSSVVPAGGFVGNSAVGSGVVGSGAIGSGAIGSGVVGSSYFAPTPVQSVPSYPASGYAQPNPYGAVVPSPAANSPCANGVCPLPSVAPSSVAPNSYAPVSPPSSTVLPSNPAVLPSNPAVLPNNSVPPSSSVPNLSIPGATVTPLGPPTIEPFPNATSPAVIPSSPAASGPGVPSLDPEAQRPPALPPSSAGSYRPATDHFVGVGSEGGTPDSRASYYSPSGAVTPPASVQNAVTFTPIPPVPISPAPISPAPNLPAASSPATSSPTLGHVLGGNAPAPSAIPPSSGATLQNGFAAPGSANDRSGLESAGGPVPVPPLLRPSTSGAARTTGITDGSNDSRSSGGNPNGGNGKVAVPLNSPEGFNPSDYWQPDLNDPNDPVASRDLKGTSEKNLARSNSSAPNIRFISGGTSQNQSVQSQSRQDSNAPAQLNVTNLNRLRDIDEKTVRWTEPIQQNIGRDAQVQNGVWFEPKK